MWSKTEADLVDIAKISEAKRRAHSSGCKEAWDDFASLMVYEFSCDGNISIIAALDLEEIMSGGLSRWVWRGFSGTFSPQNVAWEFFLSNLFFPAKKALDEHYVHTLGMGGGRWRGAET
jgi:hypothetical protein